MAARRATSTPSQWATVSVTFVAFSVATSGRKPPAASANPATAPLESVVGSAATAYAVPEVPSDTVTSRGASASPSAAAMLSPVPGPTTTSGGEPKLRRDLPRRSVR